MKKNDSSDEPSFNRTCVGMHNTGSSNSQRIDYAHGQVFLRHHIVYDFHAKVLQCSTPVSLRFLFIDTFYGFLCLLGSFLAILDFDKFLHIPLLVLCFSYHTFMFLGFCVHLQIFSHRPVFSILDVLVVLRIDYSQKLCHLRLL